MAYIGVSPSNGVRQKHTYTATASQTTFSGAGAEGISLSYRDSNYVDVYVNGVKLGDADYTATSGTSIVFDPGLPVNDIVEVIVYDVFSVADTVSKADGGTFDGNVTMAGTLAVTGETTLSANLNLGDNDKAIFGAGSDLQIYHDGSASYIDDAGTGDLNIRSSNDLWLLSIDNEKLARFAHNGAVTLYYDNASKFATTSSGIDVTGNITFGDSHTIGDDGDDNLEIATSVGENLIFKSSGNIVTYLDTNEDQSTAAYQIYGDVTSPRSLLRVEETGDISFYEDTGTTPKLFWDASNESLAVGTTSVFNSKITASSANGTAYGSASQLRISAGGVNNNRASIVFSDDALSDGKISYYPAALEADRKFSISARLNEADFVVKGNGSVGIGTTSPDALLDVENSATPKIRVGDGTRHVEVRGGSTTQNAALGTYYAGDMTFATNSTERMRIDTNGKIVVASAAPTSDAYIKVPVGGTTLGAWASYSGSSSNRLHMRFENTNGVVGSISTSGSSTSYTESSDYRLKENVTADWDATTRLKQLNPVRFNFIADADTTVDGFLAHEVQSVVPQAITGTHNEVEVWQDGEELPDGVSVGDNKLDEDGNTIPVYQGIDQSKLVPLLVKTIQELEARIVALENAE